MTWLLIFLASILVLAFLIDWRRKKNNNNPDYPPYTGSKPGDTTNYQYGDNRYTSGGGGIGGGGEQ
jgi:hypothetical protein